MQLVGKIHIFLKLKQVVHNTYTVLWTEKLHEPVSCKKVDVKLWLVILFVQYVSFKHVHSMVQSMNM